MKRRDFLAAAAILAAAVRPAMAQRSATTKRIALVHPSGNVADMRIGGDSGTETFLLELKRLGFVESTNLIIDRYSGGGKTDRYGDLAREVVSTRPDVILSTGSPMTLQFKSITTTIPIVAITGDPIRFGIISSMARPGGNITGVSVDAGLEVWGKRLALLAEAVRNLANVAFLSSQGVWENPGGRAVREVAQRLGISLVHAPLGRTKNEAEYRRTLDSLQRDQVDGIVISDESELYADRLLLVQLIQQIRIPTIYVYRDQVEAGGLMSYSYDLKGAIRRNAMQIVEILRGANPGEMPYIQEARFELVINLKTAKELNLEIPASLVARVDAVIE